MNDSIARLLESHLTKARDKLRVSTELLKLGDYDDCVSRAYYAAFHGAQALLASQGVEADTHAGIRTMFNLHFVKPKRLDAKFGRYLKNLKDDREEGDYDAVSTIDKEIAENALREATEFVEEAARFLTPWLPNQRVNDP